jgi:hypothetical protein
MCENCTANESEKRDDRSNDQYTEFLESIKNRFNIVVGNGIPLFTTNAESLFEVFLSNLLDDARQHYTCNACRHFVNRYGGLITITPDGETQSVLWDEVPTFFTKSVNTVKQVVLKSKVTGIFAADKVTLGQPVTGEWFHMHAVLPRAMVNNNRLKNADRLMAEKRENHRILIAGLTEYPVEAIDQVLAILQSETLYRGDRFLGIAQWLKELHIKRAEAKNNKIRDNITWLAAATASEGFCHIKSSMIGTLLDDIVAGLPFDSIKRRFAEKGILCCRDGTKKQSLPTVRVGYSGRK